MTSIDPGRLSERLVPLMAERQPDEAGGETVIWSEMPSIWAEWTPLAAQRADSAARRAERRQHAFLARDGEAAHSVQRILWRGRTLEVEARRHSDNSARFLILDCTEIA